MAVVHEATLEPGKVELAAAWLGRQAWGEGLEVTGRIGGYRFDDPSGKVGVEFLLLPIDRAGQEAVLHLPLTYRGAPLDGADDFLVGVAEHSVLGTRYVYDGCVDPVCVHVLLKAILTGAEQEPLEYHRASGRIEHREVTVRAHGSGSWRPDAVPAFDGVTLRRDDTVAVIEAAGFAITVKRLLDGVAVVGDETLAVSWPGGQGTLAGVHHIG